MRSNWNMGPRGPMYGRRTHRRAGAGSGLLGIFGLLIGIRVILSLIGVAGVVIGAVFTGLAAAFSGVMTAIGAVFAEVFSGTAVWAGVAVGTVIGLIAYRMIRAKKEENASRAEERRKRTKTHRKAPMWKRRTIVSMADRVRNGQKRNGGGGKNHRKTGTDPVTKETVPSGEGQRMLFLLFPFRRPSLLPGIMIQSSHGKKRKKRNVRMIRERDARTHIVKGEAQG